MSSYNNIEKIKYTKYTSDLVTLREYIVFENERAQEKYIVFKFENNVTQQLLGMEFEVSQYNIKGDLLETSVVIYDNYLAKPNEMFVPKAKLKVNFDCKTISVKLIKAAFDRFLWNEGSYEDNTYKFEHYYRDEQLDKPKPAPESKKKEKKPVEKKKKRKKGKRFEYKNQTAKNMVRFPAVFFAILFILANAAIGLSLYFFQDSSDRFTIDDFQLRLIDKSDVSIYGYVGVKKDVVIPAKLGKYDVVKIDSGAFTELEIKTVTIEVSLTIEKRAFVNCKKLTKISSNEYITVLCTQEEMCKGCTPQIVIENIYYVSN